MSSPATSLHRPDTPPHAALASRQRQGQALLVAGGLLLGTLGVFVQQAGQPALLTVWFRCAFGALALLLWAAARGRLGELRLGQAQIGPVLASSTLMLLNWALFFAALRDLPLGLATVVFHVQPLWVLLFGATLLGRPVAPGQWRACALALLGLTLASGLTADTLRTPALGRGLLLCLAGSLSYAGVTLLGQAGRGPRPWVLACWQCLLGSLALAWTPALYGWPAQAASWAWLVGLGVLHTALAYALLFAGMARLPLGPVAVLQFVYPLAAIAVDRLVYGHRLGLLQLAGIGLMGAALWRLGRPEPPGARPG